MHVGTPKYKSEHGFRDMALLCDMLGDEGIPLIAWSSIQHSEKHSLHDEVLYIIV